MGNVHVRYRLSEEEVCVWRGNVEAFNEQESVR